MATDPRFIKARIREKSNVNPIVDGQSFTKQEEVKLSARFEQIMTADDYYSKAEPSSNYKPEYPYNVTYTSLSGHTVEYDDTPGAERIMEMHKSGTFHEIHPDGSKVTKVFGDDFYLVLDDHTLTVGGNLNITVQGNANFLVKGNQKTKVDGDYELVVNGNYTSRVLGKSMHYSKDSMFIQSNQDLKLRCEGKNEILSIGNMIHESRSSYDLRVSDEFHSLTGGDHSVYVEGTIGMDAEEIYLNSDVASSNVAQAETENVDPRAGLNIPDSIIAPIFKRAKAARESLETMSGISDSGITYPKDRVEQDDSYESENSPNDWNLDA